MHALDHIEAETFSPLGTKPLVVLDLDIGDAAAEAAAFASRTRAIVIGVDRSGLGRAIDPAPFDCLITASAEADRPWVSIAPDRIDAVLASIARRVREVPHAAAVLAEVLRMGDGLPFATALRLESLAYSMLLGGGEFRRWNDGRKRGPDRTAAGGSFVDCAREDDRVTITLARPDTRNAISAPMRDALWEALAATLDDPTAPEVRLRGAGDCFSTGGDLEEFGTAADLAEAHSVRLARSSAHLLHQLGDRAEADLHGACIGSGIEIPASASRRLASRDMFAQLPELNMGLIPGAGGTVSLPRAIGRHRTCYMVLSAARIRAATLAQWGLVELKP